MSNSAIPKKLKTDRGSSKLVISPAPGNPFAIAIDEVIDALHHAPVWLHSGWISVVWRFRRTRLGPFWHTLGLAGFVLTMGVIWSRILGVDPYEYFRYVTVNLIVWSLIASFITDGTSTLVSEEATALSIRYPYAAFAFAHVWRALLTFAHHFVLYLAVIILTKYPVGWSSLLAVPAMVLLVLNGIWISLLVGIACLRWRDLIPATGTIMQVMIFITPVFWPKDMLGPELAFAADLNPLYHFIRIIREPLLGQIPPLTSWLWAVGTFAIGATVTLWVYGKVRARMPYWY